jgi:glycosyltransferase involved in cell wall biosynthesis
MRILTIVSDLAVRGTQRAAVSYTLAYQRAGHEVALLATNDGGPRESVLRRHAVPTFIARSESELQEAQRAARAFRPEVIHVHHSGAHDPKEARVLSALRKHDAGTVVIETNVFGRVDYSSEHELVDVHLQISAFCLWRWQRWLGTRPQLGVMVPYPVDTHDFRRASDAERREQRAAWGIPADAYVCGHVGYKLSRHVFDGFAALTREAPNAWLVCVPFLPNLAEYVRRLSPSVQERIVRVEPISDDVELQRAYSSFDCLLHASDNGESFGYVLAESLLCGVPVVTLSRPHRDNAQVELVHHGVGGIVAGQVARFPEAVVALYRDVALRQRVLQTGASRMQQLYDSDHVASLALRVIELAREYRDPHSRALALETDPHLRTRVADQVIFGALHNTLGGPSLADLTMMKMVTSERGQRAVRLIRHRELQPLLPRFRR